MNFWKANGQLPFHRRGNPHFSMRGNLSGPVTEGYAWPKGAWTHTYRDRNDCYD